MPQVKMPISITMPDSEHNRKWRKVTHFRKKQQQRSHRIKCIHSRERKMMTHHNHFQDMKLGGCISAAFGFPPPPVLPRSSAVKHDTYCAFIGLLTFLFIGQSSFPLRFLILQISFQSTGLGKRVGPGLRESRLLTPSGRGARVHTT